MTQMLPHDRGTKRDAYGICPVVAQRRPASDVRKRVRFGFVIFAKRPCLLIQIGFVWQKHGFSWDAGLPKKGSKSSKRQNPSSREGPSDKRGRAGLVSNVRICRGESMPAIPIQQRKSYHLFRGFVPGLLGVNGEAGLNSTCVCYPFSNREASS
jgi:hypothetical protein